MPNPTPNTPIPPLPGVPYDRPPNFFNVAVLAVAPSPVLIVPGANANPPAPLLFAFGLYAEALPLEPEQGREMIARAAVAQVGPELPPGYVVSLVSATPVPPDAILQAAAQLRSEADLSELPGTPGTRYFDMGGEAVMNTYRPGVDAGGKSPRYALRCPYCGSPHIRFTGDADARTPDGFRARLSMEADPAKYEGVFIKNADPNDAGRMFDAERSPLNLSGPDILGGSEWRERCGVAFSATCERGHSFTLRFVEDNTATGRGPAVFLVFEYGEGANAWLTPAAPGKGTYPLRE